MKADKIRLYKATDSNTLSWHFHNEYEMIYIKEGSASFVINEKETLYEKDSIIFINNLDKHMMLPVKEPYVRYIAIIDSGFLEKFVDEPMLLSVFKRRSESFSGGICLSKEDSLFVLENLELGLNEFTRAEPFCENYSMSYMLKILIYLFRRYRTCFPDFVNRDGLRTIIPLQKFLDDNFTQNITLDELAKEFFINKYHLSRIFKEATGYSINRYIMLKRIRKAKDLLYYTQNSISQTALECGFNSTSNFIRAFKNMEDITPLSFRKKFR